MWKQSDCYKMGCRSVQKQKLGKKAKFLNVKN